MQDSARKRDNPRGPIIELPPPKRTATGRPTNRASSSPPDNVSKGSVANNGSLSNPDLREVPLNRATDEGRTAERESEPSAGTQSRWQNWQICVAIVVLCVSLFLLGMHFLNSSNPSSVAEIHNQPENKSPQDSSGTPNIVAPVSAKASLLPPSVLSKVPDFPHPAAASNAPEARTPSNQESPKFNPVLSAEETQRNATAKYQRGRNHYQKGNYAKAELEYREAVVINPKFAEAWCSLGWTHLNRGQSIDAGQSFHKAVALKPTLANGWKGLAKLYIAEADATEAFDAIKHLQQLDRDAAVEVQRQVSPEFSQKLAMAEFPDLGVLDSPFNREFRRRHEQYALKEPNFLNRRDWPVKLARETAAALKERTRTPKR